MVPVVERHVDVDHAQGVARGVDRIGRNGRAALFNRDFGVGEIEAERGRNVGAVWNRRRGEELGEIDELREVDARRRGQRFNHRAIRALELERYDVDGVTEEVAVRVREPDVDSAAIRCAARSRLDARGGWIVATTASSAARGECQRAGEDGEASECAANAGKSVHGSLPIDEC